MLIAVYFLTTSPELSEELSHLLRSITGPTQFAPGCRQCTFWQNSEDPASFLIFEEWNSTEALKKHIASPIYHRVLLAMEMCTMKPDVSYVTYSSSRGFDWVQQILSEHMIKKSSEL
jgi:quinol monooxygenase YgiN